MIQPDVPPKISTFTISLFSTRLSLTQTRLNLTQTKINLSFKAFRLIPNSMCLDIDPQMEIKTRGKSIVGEGSMYEYSLF